MKFTESQIEFMREDLASNFALTKMIDQVKERMKNEGRDFDKEFQEFQKKENEKKLEKIGDELRESRKNI